MLSDKEKEAIIEAERNGKGYYDSTDWISDSGDLWPAGIVAQLRGLKVDIFGPIERNKVGGRVALLLAGQAADAEGLDRHHDGQPGGQDHVRRGDEFIEEVSNWLGFEDPDDYMDGLEDGEVQERIRDLVKRSKSC